MNEKDDIEEEDDIIEELHRIRWQIYKEAGGTPEAYARFYMKMGQERLAAEAKRRTAAATDAAKKRVKPAAAKAAKRRRTVTVS